jgi:hypothetical protein
MDRTAKVIARANRKPRISLISAVTQGLYIELLLRLDLHERMFFSSTASVIAPASRERPQACLKPYWCGTRTVADSMNIPMQYWVVPRRQLPCGVLGWALPRVRPDC